MGECRKTSLLACCVEVPEFGKVFVTDFSIRCSHSHHFDYAATQVISGQFWFEPAN